MADPFISKNKDRQLYIKKNNWYIIWFLSFLLSLFAIGVYITFSICANIFFSFNHGLLY